MVEIKVREKLEGIRVEVRDSATSQLAPASSSHLERVSKQRYTPKEVLSKKGSFKRGNYLRKLQQN